MRLNSFPPRAVRPPLRRRIAAVVGAVILAALAAVWWFTPGQLRVNVQLPEGVSSSTVGIEIFAIDRNGLLTLQAQRWAAFPDPALRETTLRARVPRGEYRVLVFCENTDRYDARVRVGLWETLEVKLTPHPGNDPAKVPVNLP